MPIAVPRLCAHCRQAHHGRCPKAQRQQWRETDRNRGTAAQRGYDAAWQRFRAGYINTVVAADPFCRDCGSAFASRADIELHHVKKLAEHPELRLDPNNIRHLCKKCHTARTARNE